MTESSPVAVAPPATGTERPRRRFTKTDFGWIALAVGVALLLRVLLTRDMRLHFITGASLTQGALVAAIALGVVLTYRGSGVVNFATGATAMYAAYVYTDLRINGKLFIPPLPNPLVLIEAVAHHLNKKSTLTVPHWPTELNVGRDHALTLPSAILVALIFAVVFGLALHFLIFRPLRNAPPLAKVVASVGVLLLLQAVVVRRFGSGAQATLLNKGVASQVKFPFGVTMNTEQVTVIAIVIVFTILLWALFRFTRFGLATRAAAENEKGAMLLGFSPDFLAGSNWVLSTGISALLGILVAGNQKSVDPLTITLLVIPALSVALVGNLTSFGITTAAAFGLAMTQALIGYFGVTRNWFPKAAGATLPGVADLLPFLVIVAVLIWRGDALPTRGSVSSGRLPFAPNPSRLSTHIVAPIVVAVSAVVLMFVATPNARLAIMTTVIGVVISLSFVVLTGYVGQISLAQMMLAGISGFALSKFSEHGIHLYKHTLIPALPFPINMLFGAFIAMVVGLIVAQPALRVRGVNLAIVTFAFAVAMDSFLFQNPGVNGGFAGAPVKVPRGINPVKTAVIGNGSGANVWFGVFCLAVLVVVAAAVVNLRRSATGRRLLATRSNERAAAAAGVDVAATKRTAFAIAAFIAGLAGGLVSIRLGKADPAYFGDLPPALVPQSLAVFAFAYLGGIACISGAVTAGLLVPGGIVFYILETDLHISPDFTLILGSLGVIVTAVLKPEGIAGGVVVSLRDRARRRDHLEATATRADRATVAASAAAAESGAPS